MALSTLGTSSRADFPLRVNSEIDDIQRRATVYIVGQGICSHWAVVFVFDDGATRVCELTAVGPRRNRWGRIEWVFNSVPGDLAEFKRERKCRDMMEDPIVLNTSPAQLLDKCRANRLNTTCYDIAFNNCQRWVKELLVFGYFVNESRLPMRFGQVALRMLWLVAAAMFCSGAALIQGQTVWGQSSVAECWGDVLFSLGGGMFVVMFLVSFCNTFGRRRTCIGVTIFGVGLMLTVWREGGLRPQPQPKPVVPAWLGFVIFMCCIAVVVFSCSFALRILRMLQ